MQLVLLHAAAIMAAALVWPPCALAAPVEPPTPASAPALTLAALVEQAWQRSAAGRSLPGRQAEVAASRELASSWLAASPVLGLAQRSDRWADNRGQRESELSLSATVARPAQVAARRSLAEHAAVQLRSQTARSRLDIAGDVRTALWDGAEAQVVVEEKRSHLHHMGELADDVRRRVAAGDLARTDALLASQEVYLARIDLARAQSQAAVALGTWRILTGHPLLPVLDPEPLSVHVGTSDTRVVAARATEQLAQAALRLTEANRYPAPTLALSLRRERDDLLTRPEKSVGIAIQVPLGSSGRNRQAEALARTQLDLAAADAARAESRAATDLDTAQIQLENARIALQAASARAAEMREHAQLIDKAFRLGERGLAEALRALVIDHEAAMAERQQRVALGRAHAQVNQAYGVVP